MLKLALENVECFRYKSGLGFCKNEQNCEFKHTSSQVKPNEVVSQTQSPKNELSDQEVIKLSQM